YMLPAITVDAPQGCQLCHVDDVGGGTSTLRGFGRLMVQLGVVQYDETSLKAALATLDADYPGFAADIKAGRDPNNDPSGSGSSGEGGATFASNTPIDPQPAYGCEVGRGRGRLAGGGLFLLFAIALGTRRRRRLLAAAGLAASLAGCESDDT